MDNRIEINHSENENGVGTESGSAKTQEQTLCVADVSGSGFKIDWVRKLSSRKFWACICGFVTPLLTALRFGDSDIALVVSIITSAGCLIAYILSEGYVDAKAAGSPRAGESPLTLRDLTADKTVSPDARV